MAVPQAKRRATIALALLGFCLTASTAMAVLFFIVGAISYLSMVFEAMRHLPPLPVVSPPKPPETLKPPKTSQPQTPKRKLQFVPGENPLEETKRVQLVIQQNTQKTSTSAQTSKITTNTPNSIPRVKI